MALRWVLLELLLFLSAIWCVGIGAAVLLYAGLWLAFFGLWWWARWRLVVRRLPGDHTLDAGSISCAYSVD